MTKADILPGGKWFGSMPLGYQKYWLWRATLPPSQPEPEPEQSSGVVYRIFNAAGDLLYVGMSGSAIQRAVQHIEKPWGREIATITIQHYATYAQALAEEAIAITAEQPRYNIRLVPKLW